MPRLPPSKRLIVDSEILKFVAGSDCESLFESMVRIFLMWIRFGRLLGQDKRFRFG